jgi:hypothetical protein
MERREAACLHQAAPLELQRIGVLPKPPNPIIFGESRQADSRPRFPQCGARGMEPRKFDDFTVRQVAEMLGVTRQVVMLWCRTRGWGYRLSPTTPWRIPRERLERILAERDAAARA